MPSEEQPELCETKHGGVSMFLLELPEQLALTAFVRPGRGLVPAGQGEADGDDSGDSLTFFL